MSASPPSLLAPVERISAILYVNDSTDPGDLPSIRKVAEEMGFDVLFETDGPDPDRESFHGAVEGAKAAGVGVLLIARGHDLVPSPASLLETFGELESEGLRLVSLLDDPPLDSRSPSCVGYLRLGEDVRKHGISRGNKKWAAERRERGETSAPKMPRCGTCGHNIARVGAKRKGHVRVAGAEPGPCLKCGCGTYRPRNVALMGA